MQASDVIKQPYSVTRDNSVNLRSYLTMTYVKEFNKCIQIKEGGVEGKRRIGKWLLSYVCLTEFCVSCKVAIPLLNLDYENCIKTMEINPMDGVDCGD
jgi:hypothetical protein